ncbi:MAG: PEP-CTERM sorting domain-containing protein [Armatimonadetes bacterium]|nr:PEP-CTERM sorting domain-containing protein [Armatimonadota bacterium]
MNTRILAISLTLLAASAHASFELLLVADNGSNTFATRAVHRFDPVSGAYLGKFGGFSGTIKSTYLDQSNNRFYVTTNLETSAWNYNTGDLIDTYTYATSATSAVRPSGDRVAYFDVFTDIQIFSFPDIVGGTALTPGVAGAQFRSGMWTSNTSLVAFDAAQSRMVNFTTNAGATSATLGVVTASAGAAAGSGQMCANAGTSQLIMAGGLGGNFRTYIPGDTGLGTVFGVGGDVLSAASAHTGFFLGSNQGATGRIDYYSKNRQLVRQFGSGIVLNPVSMQTVLAPEPGSMVVLGLGLVALLKRRKAQE